MTDKEYFEKHFFDRFVELYEDLPSGVAIKTESPDFVIRSTSGVVGVEISKILNETELGESYSPAEKNAVQQKIVQHARKIFLERHNIPLHVEFAFRDSINVRQGKDKILSNKLAQLVADQITTRSLTSYFTLHVDRGLPIELMYCGISFFPGIDESVWYSAKAQLIPNLKKEYLLSIIRKKEAKVDEYKTRADKLILLLIEGVVPDSWFDKIELIPEDELNTRFDRVLILRNLRDELITVK